TTIFQRLGKVMGALLIPFKLLLSPLKLLRGLMPLLGAGVRTLGLAFRILTGPIGIAVTILITLYKTIKYAYNNVELLKKGVEGFKGVMKTMGTATDKATDSVKVLGKGVSKETKGALGSYVKYSNSSNKILEQVKLNHGDISKKKATELLSIEEK